MSKSTKKVIEETDFSRHLKRYLKEHDMTVAELAAEVGVDRVNIYRYVKGERTPDDTETVEKILDALRMRNAEREKFLDEYDRAKMGEQVVDSHRYVNRLMTELKKISSNNVPKQHSWKQFVKMPTENNVICLESKKEIEICAALLMDCEIKCEKTDKEVCFLMQPTYKIIQELMISSFYHTDVRIEQVVCLEQNIQKSYNNLELFCQLVTNCFSEMDYHVRYYYSTLQEHINEMSWMPNMILTDVGVLQFDYEMEYGVFVENEVYVKCMKDKYSHFRKHSNPLVLKTEGLECAKQLYEGMLEDFKNPLGDDDKVVTTLFLQPCLGMCVSTDMYERYLYPSPMKELFTMGMAATRGDWSGLKHLHSGQNLPLKTANYFQLSGLKDFMESGRIREFPTGFYQPLPEEDRKMLVQRMFVLMKEGNMKYRIMADAIDMPQNVCFYLGGGERLFLNMVRDDAFIQIQIVERGICQVFRQYIEYLEKKKILLNEQESEMALREFASAYQIL